MLIEGSCHCGNIGFHLRWEPDPVEIPARACTCSFCTKHGGVWTAHPAASLRITVDDPTLLSRYAFGTHTADFLVCARCGAVPAVLSRIEGRLYAVVNVNTFEGAARPLLRPGPVSFDDESEAERLARRQRGWIGDVTIAGID
ncbi:MAG TPA: hypothetical protein VEY50_10935 [Lysobacter sp.]|nr:hypothetical protein [Lysobacter sp.]